MSADILRRAAALMRERAGAVPPEGLQDAWFDSGASDLMHLKQYDREHIASWHPAVALAVADWLDLSGSDMWASEPLHCDDGCMECDDITWMHHARRALVVARAYLGEEA